MHDDESTATLDIDALSTRGAQREVAGHFISAPMMPMHTWTKQHT